MKGQKLRSEGSRSSPTPASEKLGDCLKGRGSGLPSPVFIKTVPVDQEEVKGLLVQRFDLRIYKVPN